MRNEIQKIEKVKWTQDKGNMANNQSRWHLCQQRSINGNDGLSLDVSSLEKYDVIRLMFEDMPGLQTCVWRRNMSQEISGLETAVLRHIWS